MTIGTTKEMLGDAIALSGFQLILPSPNALQINLFGIELLKI